MLLLFVLAGLTGCTGLTASAETSTPIPTASQTPFPTATATHTPTAPPTATAEPRINVCSPLEGLTLADLSTIITNPLATPHPGLDDGHHGVDFAFWSRPDRPSMHGLPILSALPGVVAASYKDRPPYGNAVIIETPLDQFPRSLLSQLQLPTPAPTLPAAPAMTCPTPEAAQPALNAARQSIYLLYAHMAEPSALKAGDRVECGQALGSVGTTGMSVNDHLHLEARVGPANARFESLAFYIANASNQEMVDYCAWRVSQQYQILDPLPILQSATQP